MKHDTAMNAMKHTTHYWGAALLAGALLLSGCQKENPADPEPGERTAVVFSSELQIGLEADRMSRAGMKTSSGNRETRSFALPVGQPEGITRAMPVTRTVGTNWQATDHVGIYMLRGGGTTTQHLVDGPVAGANNRKYKASAGTTAAFTPATADQTVYYPFSGNVDFVAYYPYSTSVSGGGGGTITDQLYPKYPLNLTGQANTAVPQANYDFMVSRNATAVSRSASAVNLHFERQMGKIVLNVLLAGELVGQNVDNMTALLSGTPYQGNYSLFEGTILASVPVGDIALRKVATQSGYAATYEGIVFPCAANEYTGRQLQFDIPGVTQLAWDIPDEDAYVKSKVHTYTLTLSRTGITVDPVNITPWTGNPVTTTNVEPLNIETVKVQKGTFMMGTPTGEPAKLVAETHHQVTLTQDFWMSKYEITTTQFVAFLNAKGVLEDRMFKPQAMSLPITIFQTNDWNIVYEGGQWKPKAGYEEYPMTGVGWNGAIEFARWAGGNLPTEAQWEYACRAGSTMPFGLGDGKTMYGDMANIDGTWPYDYDLGWWNTESSSRLGFTAAMPQKPGLYAANAWGLYDMHGNVAEWTLDASTNSGGDAVGSDPVTDPVSWCPDNSKRYRVHRGGHYSSKSYLTRCAYRTTGIMAGSFSNVMGFRMLYAYEGDEY